ncbi:MAG: hypothetical protein B6229_08485, partial [Spirochaetaceae bacterium 4572_7]
MFKDKKIAIQGSGKVGSSIMSELTKYGVNIVAVADAGGAIFGDNLDITEMLEAVTGPTRTIIECQKGVTNRVKGAREGAVIISTECDIL